VHFNRKAVAFLTNSSWLNFMVGAFYLGHLDEVILTGVEHGISQLLQPISPLYLNFFFRWSFLPPLFERLLTNRSIFLRSMV
jgi:hypothetical protein